MPDSPKDYIAMAIAGGMINILGMADDGEAELIASFVIHSLEMGGYEIVRKDGSQKR